MKEIKVKLSQLSLRTMCLFCRGDFILGDRRICYNCHPKEAIAQAYLQYIRDPSTSYYTRVYDEIKHNIIEEEE